MTATGGDTGSMDAGGRGLGPRRPNPRPFPSTKARRRVFTSADAHAIGLTRSALRWGETTGRWRKIEPRIYADGPEPVNLIDRAIGAVAASGGVASGMVAAWLLGFDAARVRGPDLTVAPGRSGGRPGARRRVLSPDRVIVIDGIACTDGLQTLIDLAAEMSDDEWEQALESALRMRLTSIAEIEAALPELGRARARGVTRIRSVLARRPTGALPTESLLETLMVQLARRVPGLPPPERQYQVFDEHGLFVARVDLVWSSIGMFAELDGQHHEDQPVYDARRETAVVAATGWLPGRFTWREVVHLPVVTSRRLGAIADQARRRTGAGSADRMDADGR